MLRSIRGLRDLLHRFDTAIAVRHSPHRNLPLDGFGCARQINLSRMRPEETLADLVETIMGDALLALDKNGRRGTSEPIQWEITVDGVPHCYRCVEPMQENAGPPYPSKATDGTNWKCGSCGVMAEFGSIAPTD